MNFKRQILPGHATKRWGDGQCKFELCYNGNSSVVQFISYKGLNGAKNRNSVLTHLLKLEVDIVFGFFLIGDSLQKSRL